MKKVCQKENEGAIVLEVSIVLTLFMFFILLLYSFFTIFEAQSIVEHALLQSTKSLSLDSYATTKIGAEGEAVGSVGDILSSIGLDITRHNEAFSSKNKWYTDGISARTDERFNELLKTRFVAYLSEGDKQKADEILRKYKVVNGLNGISFLDSYIENKKLIVTAEFQVSYIFDFKLFRMQPMKFQQKAVSKLWL